MRLYDRYTARSSATTGTSMIRTYGPPPPSATYEYRAQLSVSAAGRNTPRLWYVEGQSDKRRAASTESPAIEALHKGVPYHCLVALVLPSKRWGANWAGNLSFYMFNTKYLYDVHMKGLPSHELQ